MYMERLRTLREKEGKLQKEIAEKLNMKQQQYQRYENGTTEMSIALLDILADYYNTSIDYIVGRTNEIKPYPRIK
ncbi:MAG: helix-turn-helix transcriptional regulator [Clostridia bacterium]|jgi:transcriptional regulator with XRE-family HTH domain|nr:helix-turn-helix transcriptional regulator [Clostridia bacterium]